MHAIYLPTHYIVRTVHRVGVVRNAGNAVNANDGKCCLLSMAILPLAAELSPSVGRRAPPSRPSRASN